MVKAKLDISARKPPRSAAAKRRDAPSPRSVPRAGRGAAPQSGPRDALATAGIDEAELTPKLRRTALSLIAEAAALRHQLTEARARIASLEKLVDEDPLMPVCNRRAFVRELTRMMAFAGRYGVPGSLVYFDVNNMKQINDAYGHAAGDATLMQVARVLVESVRATDVVGRLGGDELGVLLVQTDKALAERKAAELAALVEKRSISWHGQKLPISVAFGTYAFLGGENASAVLDAADREMYRRKTGREPDA
jgi:diguanylate cyclase (GGDEF)-like protein